MVKQKFENLNAFVYISSMNKRDIKRPLFKAGFMCAKGFLINHLKNRLLSFFIFILFLPVLSLRVCGSENKSKYFNIIKVKKSEFPSFKNYELSFYIYLSLYYDNLE